MNFGNSPRLVQKQSRCHNLLNSCKISQAAKRREVSRPLDKATQAIPSLDPACHNSRNISVFQSLECTVGSDRKKAVFDGNLANDFEYGGNDGLQGLLTDAEEFILPWVV